MILKVHPLTDSLPDMAESEMQQLCDSIQRFGQLMPILVIGDLIIDGRQRYWACNQVGVEPIISQWTGPTDGIDLLRAIVVLNISRRVLSPSQKAAYAARALPRFTEEAKKRMATSTGGAIPRPTEKIPGAYGEAAECAAQVFGVNSKYIRAAAKVRDELPAVFIELLKGTMTLLEAMRMLQPSRSSIVNTQPKLSLPKDASHLICMWGTRNQIERMKAVAGEQCVGYIRADKADGKWVSLMAPTSV